MRERFRFKAAGGWARTKGRGAVDLCGALLFARPAGLASVRFVRPGGSQGRHLIESLSGVSINTGSVENCMTKKRATKEQDEVKDAGFEAGDYVVYPTHGVGRVQGVEKQEISGQKLVLIIIKFEKDRMTLRVPVEKAEESGLRKLSSRKLMDSALATLKGRSRVKRTMWSRRAQEYEAKINSGDPVSIAEVVRDLHRGADQPDQSYSERQMYQAALDRLARELAAVEKIDEDAAALKLEELLTAA